MNVQLKHHLVERMQPALTMKEDILVNAPQDILEMESHVRLHLIVLKSYRITLLQFQVSTQSPLLGLLLRFGAIWI